MILIDKNTIYLHNGHDNDNEKLGDLWKYQMDIGEWIPIKQKGDVPPARNGHSLERVGEFLVLFGGILDITKESEEMYLFNIGTSTWQKIDLSLPLFEN